MLAERDENDAVARSKGLSRAVDLAMEKEAAAAARLAAVAKAVEQGKASTQSRADPALSGLETRAHQLREDLKELERSYTPEFLAMDSQARAMRARLAELNQQIVQQRGISLQAALQAADEEHAAAQAQVARLRSQLAAARPALVQSSARIAQAKTLEDDLAQGDAARLAVQTRPSARRRAGVGGCGSLRAGPDGHGRAVQPLGTGRRAGRPHDAGAEPALGRACSLRRARRADADADAVGQRRAGPELPAPLQLLSQAEATALLMAGGGNTRLLCALGLMGLSVDEALAVRGLDLDRAARQLHVAGAWARSLPLPPWLPATLAEGHDPQQLALHDAAGQALATSDVAALDAQLERASSVSWELLRNTAIDWLVGQGLRYTELPQLVGRVDAQLLHSLSSRHGLVPRRAAASLDLVMPALRLDPA